MNIHSPVKLPACWVRVSILMLITVLTACHQVAQKRTTVLPPAVAKTVADKPAQSETPSSTFSPRLIAYYNFNTKPILQNAERLPYTHYILSFLIPDGHGGVKPSKDLQQVLSDKAALARVQAAGKKIMVSVGGGTVTGKDWLKMGDHAEVTAASIAAIVEQYNLDGVDLDVEAVPYTEQKAFQPYADAVIALTQALAKHLPNKYLTHAPQPPYLCQPGSSGECPNDSLYATILEGAGHHISWLNMQYYSNPSVTSSDIDEVESYVSIVQGWDSFPGLDATRLVLGKPYSTQVNGYEPMTEVNSKILNALVEKYGSNFGGFMAWEFNQDENGTWAKGIHKTINADTSDN